MRGADAVRPGKKLRLRPSLMAESKMPECICGESVDSSSPFDNISHQIFSVGSYCRGCVTEERKDKTNSPADARGRIHGHGALCAHSRHLAAQGGGHLAGEGL